MHRIWAGLGLAVLSLGLAGAAPASAPMLDITLGVQVSGPVTGHLIVVAVPASHAERTVSQAGVNGGPPVHTVTPLTDIGFDGTFIVNQVVTNWRPGTALHINLDTAGKPKGLSALAGGPYAIQAFLDLNNNFANSGTLDGGDLATEVVRSDLPGAVPSLTFSRPPKPELDPTTLTAPAGVKLVDFVSPSLTAFRHSPTHIRGWVVLPPGYDPAAAQTYPTVYQFAGWGADLPALISGAASLETMMADKRLPPMFWVLLDHSHPAGTQEFADSVNNGPYGGALTSEVIPYLEKTYRMDGRPSGRFLTGHSSGGWAALWDQVAYPKVFGGTWPTSPDPSTFSNFSGIDILAPNANFYHDAAGKPWPMLRSGTTVLETFESEARQEDLMGNGGAYLGSYEWVFSPSDGHGQPRRLFDRQTGAIDPAVALYWRDHFDMAFIIQRDWARLKPDLDGKIHVTVGDQDNYLYEGPAHVLKAALDKVCARSDFNFIAGGTHGIRTPALVATLAQQMYEVARPGSGFVPAPQPAPAPPPAAARPVPPQ